jgi:hypothetical protein
MKIDMMEIGNIMRINDRKARLAYWNEMLERLVEEE